MIDEDKVVHGNIRDEDDLYLSPTIIANVEPTDKIMQDEIFGPVIAVRNVASVQDAVKFIRSRYYYCLSHLEIWMWRNFIKPLYFDPERKINGSLKLSI